MSSDAQKPSGLILPSDPSFYELPPPPGSEPSLEEKLASLEADDRDQEREADAGEPVPVVAGSVDGHVELADEDAITAYDEHRAHHPFERTVLVQPEALGGDHNVLLKGLERLAVRDERSDLTRGLASVDLSTSDSELRDLSEGGVIATRFAMRSEASRLDWMELSRIAARVHDQVGWDVSLGMDGRYLAEVEAMIRDWPGRVLLEYSGQFLGRISDRDPGFRAMMRLIDRDRMWVSLAGPWRWSRDGSPRFRDAEAVAKALLRFAPERIVWGSDWPVGGDAADAFDLLGDWCEDETLRRRLLVDNATEFFRYKPSP